MTVITKLFKISKAVKSYMRVQLDLAISTESKVTKRNKRFKMSKAPRILFNL